MVNPHICWQPSKEQIDAAAVTQFARFLTSRTGRDYPDYEALWRASVDDIAGFWQAVADYFPLRWHEEPSGVLAERAMPGTLMPGSGGADCVAADARPASSSEARARRSPSFQPSRPAPAAARAWASAAAAWREAC